MRATTSEWLRYYQRADRARARLGDPFQWQIRRRRLRDRLFNICATVAFVAATAVCTALAFSFLERANLP